MRPQALLAAMVIAASAMPSPASGNDELFHWVFAPITNVAVTGDLIFASRGPVLIRTDPADPEGALRELQLDEPIVDLAIDGGALFVLTASRLRVFDIDRELDESEIGSVVLGSPWSGMAAGSGRVFLAAPRELGIVDVSGPEDPRFLGSIERPDRLVGVTVDGGRVYPFSQYSFEILEIDADLGVLEIGRWAGDIEALRVRDSLAYVCATAKPLEIVSLNDPAAPESVAVLRTASLDRFGSLAVDGDLVFVGSDAAQYALRTIDVSNPDEPVIVGRMNWTGGILEIASSGGNSVFGGEQDLVLLDADFPARPFPSSVLSFQRWVVSIAADGDHCFVGTQDGVRILDLTAPEHPETLPLIAASPEFAEIVVEDGLLVGRYRANEYRFFDLQNLENPVEFPPWYNLSYVKDMELEDDTLFLAAYWEGLLIVDVSDPSSPSTVGGLRFEKAVTSVVVEGRTAALAAFGVLYLVDVSDPSVPVNRAEIDFENLTPIVAAGGGLFFVAATDRVYVLDPGEETDPRVGKPVRFPAGVRALISAGDNLWCVLNDGELRVLDMRSPRHPRLIAVFDETEYSGELAAGRNWVAAEGDGGVRILSNDDLQIPPRNGGARSRP